MKKFIPAHSVKLTLLFCITLLFACRRDIEPLDLNTTIPKLKTSIQAQAAANGCVEDADYGLAYDSLPRPTLLGYRLINNPYSVANMQQASQNLYGTSSGIYENKWYVRFKPSGPEQLSLLDSLDIDLFDYPLDYEVVQEGDYYDDGTTPAEEIPWLYAVVSAGFTPPAGVQYELLQRLHVPQFASIEAEAFRITGNPVEDTTCTITASIESNKEPAITPQRVPICPPGYVWSRAANQCIELQDDPPPPPTPPMPTPTRQPTGTIRVHDNNRNDDVPLRNVQVIAKRFLKVERVHTNTQGQYFITKEFRKVNIYVRTKNSQASIRSLRRARLWQMLLPVEVHLGKFSGSLNNIDETIEYNQDALSSGARHWAAATVHNNVQEYYDYAAQLSIGTPPQRLKVLLTNWRWQGTSGAAPMFAKRFWQDLPQVFVTTFIASSMHPIAGGLTALVHVLKKEVDVTIGYNTFNRNFSPDDITDVSGDIGETAFHELTHAAHYNKAGNNWWQDFVNAELTEMMFSGNSPYGNGNNGSVSDIIALGESWAYHVGHFMSDRKYAANSSELVEQGFLYTNGDIQDLNRNTLAITNLNAHLNLLEDFSPRRLDDPDRWIPQGLYYDLIDDRNDLLQTPIRVGVNDQVTNFYTNASFFNALDPDIRSMDAFRVRLLNENGSTQATFVNEIFTFYENWQ